MLLVSCAENPADNVVAARDVEGTIEANTGSGKVYSFTPESKIGFVASKVTRSHNGGFTAFTGQFETDGTKLFGTENKIVIDMASTWADDVKLTGHLKSPDFFDVATYPTSTFELLRAEKAEGENKYTLAGKFTLHGVTKQISFPAEIYRDGNEPALDAEFAINRKDYGIEYPGKPDDLIRDEVVIKLAMRSKPAA